MKNILTGTSSAKFLIADNEIFCLSYSRIQNKAGVNGICAICRCYGKEEYFKSDIPKAKHTIKRIIYLKNKSEKEILSIIDFLSRELVAPDDVKDVVKECFG